MYVRDIVSNTRRQQPRHTAYALSHLPIEPQLNTQFHSSFSSLSISSLKLSAPSKRASLSKRFKQIKRIK